MKSLQLTPCRRNQSFKSFTFIGLIYMLHDFMSLNPSNLDTISFSKVSHKSIKEKLNVSETYGVGSAQQITAAPKEQFNATQW